MTKAGFVCATLFAGSLTLQGWSKTYKNTYPIACSELWTAVTATLDNQDNYAKVQRDDAKMTADYSPKHAVHFDVSGVLLQRMNHVTLVTKGAGCEMQVVSNYSGWGHEDQGDFKKRVDDALAKPKGTPPAEPAKPAKPAD